MPTVPQDSPSSRQNQETLLKPRELQLPSFPKHFIQAPAMEASAAVESSAAVSVFEVVSSKQRRPPDTAKLVLNSPSPPSLREELVGVVGKAFRPRAHAGAGAGAGGRPPPRRAWVLTALQCVFPVLQWGRSYTLESFRSDVMAGLTLASLGIPQVCNCRRSCHVHTLACSIHASGLILALVALRNFILHTSSLAE